MQEFWKDVKGYEGLYQISDLGRVKSLSRHVKHWKGGSQLIKERIMKPGSSGEYSLVILSKNGNIKGMGVHQLVAIAFLNHVPCGHELEVNHIDVNPKNNRLENLEIVTHRVNGNMKHLKSSSIYTGVSWHKATSKWISRIIINRKLKHLGVFSNEHEAHLAYQKALKEIC